jgi:tyrosine-specific transport protein
MRFLKGGMFGAVATMVGLIVGAGVLGLPYVMAQAGFFTGLLIMLIVVGLIIVSGLYMGEVVQRTAGKHSLPGLIERYLGKWGKRFLTFFFVFGSYGAMSAYVIASGDLLSVIFGIDIPIILSILFWIICSVAIYFGLRQMETVEKIFSPLKVLLLIVIGVFLFSFIDFGNLASFSFSKLHVPFAVILFALFGLWSIVEMNEELKDKRLLKKSLIWAVAISAVCYLIFSFALVGIMGSDTPQVATTGLEIVGGFGLVLINLFALLAVGTAYVALGYALKEMFIYDYSFKVRKAWGFAVSIPLIMTLIRPTSFIQLLGLTATIGGGMAVVMFLIAHSKAQRRGTLAPSYTMPNNWWLKGALILIFVLATVWEVVGLFL